MHWMPYLPALHMVVLLCFTFCTRCLHCTTTCLFSVYVLTHLPFLLPTHWTAVCAPTTRCHFHLGSSLTCTHIHGLVCSYFLPHVCPGSPHLDGCYTLPVRTYALSPLCPDLDMGATHTTTHTDCDVHFCTPHHCWFLGFTYHLFRTSRTAFWVHWVAFFTLFLFVSSSGTFCCVLHCVLFQVPFSHMDILFTGLVLFYGHLSLPVWFTAHAVASPGHLRFASPHIGPAPAWTTFPCLDFLVLISCTHMHSSFSHDFTQFVYLHLCLGSVSLFTGFTPLVLVRDLTVCTAVPTTHSFLTFSYFATPCWDKFCTIQDSGHLDVLRFRLPDVYRTVPAMRSFLWDILFLHFLVLDTGFGSTHATFITWIASLHPRFHAVPFHGLLFWFHLHGPFAHAMDSLRYSCHFARLDVLVAGPWFFLSRTSSHVSRLRLHIFSFACTPATFSCHGHFSFLFTYWTSASRFMRTFSVSAPLSFLQFCYIRFGPHSFSHHSHWLPCTFLSLLTPGSDIP